MAGAAHQTAIFAAGCFWGVQYYFDQVPGVIKTAAGYTGGHTNHPTYEQVSHHITGHAEAVKITYDPEIIGFEALLKQFFRMHDPTQLNRQGPDIGDQYRSAIFYRDSFQKAAAQRQINTINATNKYNRPLATRLEPAGRFWPAEDYHQKFTERTDRGMCHVPYAAV